MSVVSSLLAVVAREDEPTRAYECRQCGARFAVQHHCCPECDSYSVERREWTVDSN